MGVEWRIYEFANVNIEHVLLTRRLEISGRAIISLCTPLVWLLVRAGRVYFSNEDVYLYSALWGLFQVVVVLPYSIFVYKIQCDDCFLSKLSFLQLHVFFQRFWI